MRPTDIHLADPGWFPVDLHVPERTVSFLRVDADVIEQSTFLDVRIRARLEDAQPMPLEDLDMRDRAPSLGWLFHTSFCCSTLLARALHVAPRQVVLKEPLVLRRLGDARRSGWPVDDWLEPVATLLGRPWSADGTVVVKPTHAALNIGGDLLRATPSSRAVVLSSSLDDFIVSNVKKLPPTQAKIPELAERALSATALGRRLPAAALSPPDLIAAATLQWAAQREICAALVRSAGPARVRVLDADALLADVAGVTVRTAKWLRTSVDDGAIRRRAHSVEAANAKATDVAYGPDMRAAEAARVRAHYAPVIDGALRWAERWVLPALAPEALHFPGEWSVLADDPNTLGA